MVWAFLGTMFGRWLMIGGVGALTIMGAYLYGYTKGNTNCAAQVKLAEAQAAIKALEHEKSALEQVVAEQDAIETRNLEELEAERTKVAALEALVNERDYDCPIAATEDEMRAIERIK